MFIVKETSNICFGLIQRIIYLTEHNITQKYSYIKVLDHVEFISEIVYSGVMS